MCWQNSHMANTETAQQRDRKYVKQQTTKEKIRN
jgi:hypothetical protein